jgi:hypothetical protein
MVCLGASKPLTVSVGGLWIGVVEKYYRYSLSFKSNRILLLIIKQSIFMVFDKFIVTTN